MRRLHFLIGCLGACLLRADIVCDAKSLSWLASQFPQPSLWYRAAQSGDVTAHQALTEFAQKQSDAHWLMLSAGLGDPEAYFTLANNAESTEQFRHWLERGAELGHAPSQYELGLSVSSEQTRQRWLVAAAEQDYLPAVKALYQWHLLRDDFDTARPWLEMASQTDSDSALQLARLQWSQGKHSDANDMFTHAAQLGSQEARDYREHIQTFYRKTVSETQGLDRHKVERDNCIIRIQPVADSLDAVRKATITINKFRRDNRLVNLPICINPPVWLSDKALQCDPDWGGQRRLGCDEGPLSLLGQEAPFSHLVVHSTLGKANVNNGIMYLDLADTYDVFVHELAHFAGFADEYPLSSTMAARQCAGNSAPNLVVVGEDEELRLEDMAQWMKASDAIELSSARTCNNHRAQAYKPVSAMTFMEFYDQRNIPQVYLTLWLAQLENAEVLTPAYVNFSQYYQRKGDEQQAQIWWQKFIDFRQQDSAPTALSSE